jgi:hypothetical protein
MLICNAYSRVKGKSLKIFDFSKQDYMTCDCGNIPETDGFFPCDSNGNEMEPLLGSNWDSLYICARCKEIYNTIN